MTSSLFSITTRLCIPTVLLLSACSPKYDWREVHGEAIPFTVLLPSKPLRQTRTINLDGTQVAMTMTAAEANDATFAVGTADLPDAEKARHALGAMQNALVHNINGKVNKETTANVNGQTTIGVEASGPQHAMFARLVAKDQHVYQVIAIGKAGAIPPEEVDTFLTSFKAE